MTLKQSMPKSPLPHLYRMRDSIKLIFEYIQGFSLHTFSKDHKTWDAVVKQIENIGEEVNKLEVNFRQAHPEFPWKDMVATRNKLAHDYWDINPKRVWEIATIDIPHLEHLLLPLLKVVESQEAKTNS
jgi:uncharacterized protein with HEPN domain